MHPQQSFQMWTLRMITPDLARAELRAFGFPFCADSLPSLPSLPSLHVAPFFASFGSLLKVISEALLVFSHLLPLRSLVLSTLPYFTLLDSTSWVSSASKGLLSLLLILPRLWAPGKPGGGFISFAPPSFVIFILFYFFLNPSLYPHTLEQF